MGAMFLRLLCVFFFFFAPFASTANAHSVEHIQKVSRGRVSIEDAERIVAAVHRSSAEHNVDPAWIFKMIQAESAFNPRARSPMNAKGVMQIIVKWHPVEIAKRDVYDIDVNIDAGTRIVRKYLDQCSNNMRCAMRKYNGSSGNRYYAKVYNMKLYGEPSASTSYAFFYPPPVTREEKLTALAMFIHERELDSRIFQ